MTPRNYLSISNNRLNPRFHNLHLVCIVTFHSILPGFICFFLPAGHGLAAAPQALPHMGQQKNSLFAK